MIIKSKSCYLKHIEEKKKYQDKWVDWFAWYPTRVDERTIAWFQIIQRRRNYYMEFSYDYSYRLKESEVI